MPALPFRFVSATRSGSVSSLAFLRAVRRLVRRTGPPTGVVHCQRPDDLVPFARVDGRSPRIVTIHGDPLPGIRSRHGRLGAVAYLRTERQGVEIAHRILFIDPGSRASLSERYPDFVGKFGETDVGVDLAIFRRQDSDSAKRHWDLPDRPHVLFAGRFAPEKNLGLLSQALRLCTTRPVLLLAGIGPGEGRVRESLEGVSHRFLGIVPHEEMPILYSAVDATVITSTREAMPLLCIESLACGTPVVATRVGRLPELITPGENGFLSEANPHDLSRMIDTALEHRKEMSANCRETAVPFGWDRVLPNVLREYEKAVP